MTTGYVYPVAKGVIATFPAFAMSCARAFGALVHMREEGANATITPRVPSDYYPKAIESLAERLATIKGMTTDEIDVQQRSNQESASARATRYRTEWEQETARIDTMLAEVEAWTPPTVQHQNLKTFMAEQLRISRSDKPYAPHMPTMQEAEAWRAEQIETLEDQIDGHTKYMEADVKSCRDANDWIAALAASVSP